MNFLTTIFLDLPTALGGPLGGRILDLLVLATAAGIAYRLPRTAPYLAVFGVGFQSNLTHVVTSDGDILAGLCLGLAAGRLRSRRLLTSRRLSRALIPLLLLNVVAALSYLANSRGPNQMQIALGTEYFVSRSVLAVTLILLSDEDSDWQLRWARAIGSLAFILAMFRLGQIIGLPVKFAADALGISLLGDYTDSSNANLYAVLLGIGIPMLLAGSRDKDNDRVDSRKAARWIAAAIVTLAMASTASRTGAVIIVAVFAVLLWSARNAVPRFAVGGLAAIYVLGSLLPALSITQRPVIVASISVPDRSVATNLPPVAAPPHALIGQPSPLAIQPQPVPAIRPQWRSVLDRNYYRIQQHLPTQASSEAGHYVLFGGAAGGGGVGVVLLIRVNGTLIAELRPADMTTDYRWYEVPIPGYIVAAGKPATIELSVAGNPNSTRDYFLIGGVRARSDGYSSRIWTGESWSEMDLSSDPGTQTGIVMVFMDGVVPSLNYFTESSTEAIDTSVADRFTLWRSALNAFAHNPLLGTGFYTFGLVRSQYVPSNSTLFYPYANAHSNYFQLLSDLGGAGPLLFVLIYALPLIQLARNVLHSSRQTSWLALALSLALVTCLISSFTQTWIADSRFYMLSWFIALVSSPTISTREQRPVNAAAMNGSSPADIATTVGDPRPLGRP